MQFQYLKRLQTGDLWKLNFPLQLSNLTSKNSESSETSRERMTLLKTFFAISKPETAKWKKSTHFSNKQVAFN